MQEDAIKVDCVTKIYGGRKILDGICLEVHQGETLVILGGSGSGKSTLLRLMIGNVRPDGGEILVREPAADSYKNACAMNVTEPDAYRRSIGVLFQSAALYNSMSV